MFTGLPVWFLVVFFVCLHFLFCFIMIIIMLLIIIIIIRLSLFAICSYNRMNHVCRVVYCFLFNRKESSRVTFKFYRTILIYVFIFAFCFLLVFGEGFFFLLVCLFWQLRLSYILLRDWLFFVVVNLLSSRVACFSCFGCMCVYVCICVYFCSVY